MSKFTTELRWICETSTNTEIDENGFNSIEQILNACHSNVFNFSYPIFDENYRATLEKKILRHYYTREICEETVGLWKLRLCDKMNMIMPYYNQLYSSTTLEFNPLYDFNYSEEQTSSKTGRETKTGSREISGNSENVVDSQINRDIAENNTITNNLTNVMEYGKVESKTGNDSVQHTGSDTNNIEGVQWDKYSDTPQGGISNIDNDTYLTNARKNTDDTTNQIVYNSTNTNAYNSHVSNSGSDTESKTGSVITENSVSDAKTVSTTTTNENTETISDNKVNTITNTDEYVKRVSGKKSAKSYGVMIEEYRHSLINIDTLIIDELSDLFFGLWE